MHPLSNAPPPLLPLLLLLLLLLHLHPVSAHGFLAWPPQRGSLHPLAPYSLHPHPSVPKEATDYFMHFPSGPKVKRPGAGHAYQSSRAAKYGGWRPYDPFSPTFPFRAGLCGDTVTGPSSTEHLRGGVYYASAKVTATYTQGGILDIQMGVTVHHNGFMELYLCDVAKCGGEISRACFLRGFCYQLKRAGNAWDGCAGRNVKNCGPVDDKYPGRWYVPCASEATYVNGKPGFGRVGIYGSGTIKYRLPPNVHCEHCVLQWYWTSANNCNPPGLREYFEGPTAPKGWPRCYGQGGAVGGFTASQKECGEKVPEEYYQCADIAIVRKGQPNTANNKKPGAPPPVAPGPQKGGRPSPTKKNNNNNQPRRYPSPSPRPKRRRPSTAPKPRSPREFTPSNGFGAVLDVVLVRNGARLQSLMATPRVKWFSRAAYTVEAYTSASTTRVRFQVYVGRGLAYDTTQRRRVGSTKRFFLFGRRGNGAPTAWRGFPLGQFIRIRVTATDTMRTDVDSVYVLFYR